MANPCPPSLWTPTRTQEFQNMVTNALGTLENYAVEFLMVQTISDHEELLPFHAAIVSNPGNSSSILLQSPFLDQYLVNTPFTTGPLWGPWVIAYEWAIRNGITLGEFAHRGAAYETLDNHTAAILRRRVADCSGLQGRTIRRAEREAEELQREKVRRQSGSALFVGPHLQVLAVYERDGTVSHSARAGEGTLQGRQIGQPQKRKWTE